MKFARLPTNWNYSIGCVIKIYFMLTKILQWFMLEFHRNGILNKHKSRRVKYTPFYAATITKNFCKMHLHGCVFVKATGLWNLIYIIRKQKKRILNLGLSGVMTRPIFILVIGQN